MRLIQNLRHLRVQVPHPLPPNVLEMEYMSVSDTDALKGLRVRFPPLEPATLPNTGIGVCLQNTFNGSSILSSSSKISVYFFNAV